MHHRNETDEENDGPINVAASKFSLGELTKYVIIGLWMLMQFYLQTHYTAKVDYDKDQDQQQIRLRALETSLQVAERTQALQAMQLQSIERQFTELAQLVKDEHKDIQEISRTLNTLGSRLPAYNKFQDNSK